jgi:hypothetical protein
MTTTRRKVGIVITVVASTLLALAVLAPVSLAQGPAPVRGGGTSMIAGGTGAPSFAPIVTKFAISWRQGQGRFECLALTPAATAGSAGSGNFDTNIMYVTGKITSADVRSGRAVLTGTATVTGAGAGTNRPFTLTLTKGGPGATLLLVISGMTFNEIVTEGEIRF